MSDEIQNGNGDAKTRWKHRRKMAWASLGSIIIVTFLILFTDFTTVERLKVLSDVITWYYFSCASVVGAYMGFNAWANKK
jgi:hypothetical protein